MPLYSKLGDIVIPEASLPEFVFAGLQKGGDRTAIIEAVSGREFTFRDIFDETVKCASALRRQGLEKGDFVATCCMNCAEYAIMTLAAATCGATITTCNPYYTADEIKRQFQNSQPKFVFASASVFDKVNLVAASISSIQNIFCIGETQTKGVETYKSLLSVENGSAFPNFVQFDVREDVLFLPYSSGTTGLPKGVMVTHHNFITILTLIRFKPDPDLYSTCEYSALPLFHMFGLVRLFGLLSQGIRHVLDVRFSLETLFSSIEKYKIAQLGGVPPMLLQMAKSPLIKKYDLSSLKSIFSSAAPLPDDVADLVKEKFQCDVCQAWGMTEGSPFTFANPVFPVKSVGQIAPNTKVKIVDVITGKELGPYQNGELCAKGPQVMKGYFKNPEATRNTIDVDGWLHTGDVGYYDDNELIYIVDRLKELIKYKGFQVAPAELEAILVSHPKISDAAVVGIPDNEAGEIAKAFIVRSDESLTKQQIHEFIAGKLSRYKHLHGGIEFRSKIEKTPTGKILRRVYRREAAGKANL